MDFRGDLPDCSPSARRLVFLPSGQIVVHLAFHRHLRATHRAFDGLIGQLSQLRVVHERELPLHCRYAVAWPFS